MADEVLSFAGKIGATDLKSVFDYSEFHGLFKRRVAQTTCQSQKAGWDKPRPYIQKPPPDVYGAVDTHDHQLSQSRLKLPPKKWGF